MEFICIFVYHFSVRLSVCLSDREMTAGRTGSSSQTTRKVFELDCTISIFFLYLFRVPFLPYFYFNCLNKIEKEK